MQIHTCVLNFLLTLLEKLTSVYEIYKWQIVKKKKERNGDG